VVSFDWGFMKKKRGGHPLYLKRGKGKSFFCGRRRLLSQGRKKARLLEGGSSPFARGGKKWSRAAMLTAEGREKGLSSLPWKSCSKESFSLLLSVGGKAVRPGDECTMEGGGGGRLPCGAPGPAPFPLLLRRKPFSICRAGGTLPNEEGCSRMTRESGQLGE